MLYIDKRENFDNNLLLNHTRTDEGIWLKFSTNIQTGYYSLYLLFNLYKQQKGYFLFWKNL